MATFRRVFAGQRAAIVPAIRSSPAVVPLRPSVRALTSGIVSRAGAQAAVPLGHTPAVRRTATRLPTISNKGVVGQRASSTLAAAASTLPPTPSHPSFTIKKSEFIAEHNAMATLYVHKASGAEVLSIQCDEEEKVFGILFKTPVTDDTGVPHILEHSVLCGSRKYNVKEPFVQLLKSSLKTYLNAMTYSDRTVYPVASPNLQDFYNLVDVYLDAVFHPRLDRWVLDQEGWHYEVETPPAAAAAAVVGGGKGVEGEVAVAASVDPPISYKGVVFNEMKGVYSSPDSIRSYETEAALFPDNNYRHSSGGDPLTIPTLTYDAFIAFHRKYYQPSNSRVFWFGDDDVMTRLTITDAYLTSGAAQAAEAGVAPASPTDNTVTLQSLFTAPRRLSRPYPCTDSSVGEEEEGLEEEEEGDAEDGELEEGIADTNSNSSSSSSSGGGVKAGGGGKHGVGVVSLPAPTPGVWQAPTTPFTSLETIEGAPDKHDVTVNWVLNSHPLELDDTTRLGLAVLNHLLMQTHVAVLYKALADSALGSSVIGGGYDDSSIQATFSAGLKGVRGVDVPRVEQVLLGVVESVARDGFTHEHLQSAFNTIEFQLREFANGGTPRGLALFLGTAAGWMYGKDPIEDLRFEDALKALRVTVKADPQYFQKLISKFLINNQHRLTLHMYPDPLYTARRQAAERAQLAAKAATLTASDLAAMRVHQEELMRLQSTPDSPEEVAKIPTLKVSDLPLRAKTIPLRVAHLGLPPGTGGAVVSGAGAITTAASSSSSSRHSAHGVVSHGSSGSVRQEYSPQMLVHEQPTNGIAYASLHFDLSPLPLALLPYMPLFTWCMSACGTESTDEVAMAHQLGTHTGGIGASSTVLEVPGRNDLALPYMAISGKALKSEIPRLGALTREMLLTARLDRKDRIAHYLRSSISRHESSLVSSGHRYATSLLAAQYTKSGWIGEVLGGVTQLYTSRMLLEKVESADPHAFESVVADLLMLRSILLNNTNAIASVTGDATCLPALEAEMASLVASLPSDSHATTHGLIAATTAAGTSAGTGAGSEHKHFFGGVAARLSSGWHWPALGHSRGGSISSPALSHAKGSQLPHWPFPHLLASDAGPSAPSMLGIVVPTQVNYVVKGAPGWHLKGSTPGTHASGSGAAASHYKASPSRFVPGSAEVVSNIINTGYLWEKVRVVGGAYGGFSSLDRFSGLLTFGSYRDPNLADTLTAFDGVADHLSSWDGLGSKGSKGSKGKSDDGGDSEHVRGELSKGIMSTIGGMDAPMTPEEKGATSTARYLTGISDEDVQQRRDEILGTSGEAVLAFAEASARVRDEGRIVVVASEAAFKQYHAANRDKQMFELSRPLNKGNTKGK